MEAEEIDATKDLLTIQRVSYGRADTPEADREYRVYGVANSPVGTKADWERFASEQNLKGLRIMEADGSIGFLLF